MAKSEGVNYTIKWLAKSQVVNYTNKWLTKSEGANYAIKRLAKTDVSNYAIKRLAKIEVANYTFLWLAKNWFMALSRNNNKFSYRWRGRHNLCLWKQNLCKVSVLSYDLSAFFLDEFVAGRPISQRDSKPSYLIDGKFKEDILSW